MAKPQLHKNVIRIPKAYYHQKRLDRVINHDVLFVLLGSWILKVRYEVPIWSCFTIAIESFALSLVEWPVIRHRGRNSYEVPKYSETRALTTTGVSHSSSRIWRRSLVVCFSRTTEIPIGRKSRGALLILKPSNWYIKWRKKCAYHIWRTVEIRREV